MSKNSITLVLLVALVFGGVVWYSMDNNTDQPAEEELPKLSSQEAGQKALKFVNKRFLQGQDVKASLGQIVEEAGLYKVNIKVKDQTSPAYISKDGKLFFPQAMEIDSALADTSNKDIPKKDKPEVKLFVMSYCPYGLQAQKMFLPVKELLGNKLDMEIAFVDYAMHDKKELDENLTQYCLQKNSPRKYSDYLSCFVKDGQSEQCLAPLEVNQDQLTSCIQQTDKQFEVTKKYQDKSTWSNGQFPLFPVQQDLNEKYEVKGSPTVVINGQQSDVSPRSPENFKQVVCQAFNNPPKECSQTLSTDAPSPGLGGGISQGGSSGSCE